MQQRYDEIQTFGAKVVVVSFEPSERLPIYQEIHNWAFPVVSDPDRAAYRAFGLDRAGWGRLLRPRVVWLYLKLLAQGKKMNRSEGDVHQLGGDFVIDVGRRVVFAHRSTDPSDRPEVAAIISALREPGRG